MVNYQYPLLYLDSSDYLPRSREINFEYPTPWEEQQQQQNYKAKLICGYDREI
ncbi:octicosapeptide/Phox/Bem1p domain-containing protein [Sesbania bispinosa]|nr:octicosapeptide/Phox/Bem1p domain-containing protein [Sesbania bispinosa]